MNKQPAIALWATDAATYHESLDAWIIAVETRLAEAAAAGAWMLVMPEDISQHWVAFRPKGAEPHPTGDFDSWLAEIRETVMARLHPLTDAHGIGLLPGTCPARRADGAIVNRATVLLPGGRRIDQDKLCPTPGEHDMGRTPGDTLIPFDWNGVRWAVMTCLDVEQPDAANLLIEAGVEIVLTPSMTASRAGYHRVFSCARARAVEMMAVVCAVGAVGSPEYTPYDLPNFSGAGVFIPSEPSLGDTGVFADLPGSAVAPTDGGAMLIARDIPLERVRELRKGTAQVWRGAWPADHVKVAAVDTGASDQAAE